MENQKSVSSVVETQKSRPVLFIFSVILLLGLVASALYLSFTKTAIQDQQKQLDTDITTLNSQIDDLKSQNVEGQQYAQQWLADLEKTEIHWSEVIKTIQSTLPVDPLTQKPVVEFLTYSGSTGGKLTLNAQTIEGAVNPFENLTTLIGTFNNSAFFKDAYVPSVSHGVSQSGQDLLSFVFNVTYQENPSAVNTTPSTTTTTTTTSTTPVPRVPTATSSSSSASSTQQTTQQSPVVSQ